MTDDTRREAVEYALKRVAEMPGDERMLFEVTFDAGAASKHADIDARLILANRLRDQAQGRLRAVEDALREVRELLEQAYECEHLYGKDSLLHRALALLPKDGE